MSKHQAFSTGKVAKMFGASVEAVNYWIRQGKLKAYRTPGGHYRVDSQDLLDFKDQTGAWMNPDELVDTVPRILVIDDEEHMRNLVRDVFSDEYEVSIASGGLEGCMLFGEMKPDILIVDVRMPDISGYRVVQMIKDKFPEPVRIVVMTAYPYDVEAEKLKLLEIDGFLQKPFDLNDLKRLVYSLDTEEQTSSGSFTPSTIQ